MNSRQWRLAPLEQEKVVLMRKFGASSIVLAACLATGCVDMPKLAHGQQPPAMSVASETPEQFLDKVFKRYRLDGPGVSIGDTKVAKRVYADSLYELMQKDISVSGDSGKLDADPICDNCQDYDISDPIIILGKSSTDHVSATATFKNGSEQHKVTYDLIHVGPFWKINDVSTKAYNSLKAFLNAPIPSAPISKAVQPK